MNGKRARIGDAGEESDQEERRETELAEEFYTQQLKLAIILLLLMVGKVI